MKTLTRLFAALLLTAGLCAVPAGAANQVERLTTGVALEQDGLAHVTQVFSAQTDEGTEFYMDRLTSGGLTYANFAVSDENMAPTPQRKRTAGTSMRPLRRRRASAAC